MYIGGITGLCSIDTNIATALARSTRRANTGKTLDYRAVNFEIKVAIAMGTDFVGVHNGRVQACNTINSVLTTIDT